MKIAITLASLLAVFGSRAEGAVLFDGLSTTLASHLTGNYSRGNEFTLSSTLQIFGLAYIDAEGDGLRFDHEVTLWKTSDSSLVASAFVSSSNSYSISANGVSRWYEAQISAIALDPGTYRIVGLYGSGDAGLDSTVSTSYPGVSLSSGYVRNGFPNGGTSFPSEKWGTQQLTANVVVIPEPSSTLLLGLGVLGVVIRRRRTQ